MYSILVDMAGRTIQIVNTQQQCVAMLQKSLQTLIMNASLGAGSEMTIDIAPGGMCLMPIRSCELWPATSCAMPSWPVGAASRTQLMPCFAAAGVDWTAILGIVLGIQQVQCCAAAKAHAVAIWDADAAI